MSEILNTFVGRKPELERWQQILGDIGTTGRAIVVVGKYGMGKTWLLDRMIETARRDENLQCGVLRYSVAPNESPGMLMKMLLEDAFQAARAEAGSLQAEGKRFFQWNRFYRDIGLFSNNNSGSVGTVVDYEFLNALRYDSRKHIFEQFISRLELLAQRLPDNGRLLLAVDPEQDTPQTRIDQWSEIVRSLPPKVFMLFAQRFKDSLAEDEVFQNLDNVVFLPPKPEALSDLSELETLHLSEAYRPLLADKPIESPKLIDVFKGYRNHPFAVHAALNLLLCKNINLPEQLPKEPMPHCICPFQWEQIVKHPLARSAVMLFEAYVVLEVPTLDEMACWVADISPEELQAILADPFLRSLIRDEPDGRMVYHHYLSDHIRKLLYTSDDDLSRNLTMEAERLHQRALIGYGELMRRTLKPDPLATVRFPEHSLAVGGPELFAEALDQSADAFLSLGFFQSFGEKIERALSLVAQNSVQQSDLCYLMGRLREQQGNPNEARKHYEQSLDIARKIIEPERAAEALFALGRVAAELRLDEEAEKRLAEAVAYYETGPDQVGLVETLVLLGQIYWRRNKIAEGETVLNEAVTAAQKIRNYRQQARSLAGIFAAWGRIFDEVGDLTHAADLFNKAIDLTQDIYDREAEAEVRSRLGSVFERTGNLKTAEENLSKAMEIHQDLKQIEHWAEDCFRLAMLAQKQGKSQDGQKRFEQARQLYQQIGNAEKVEEVELASGIITRTADCVRSVAVPGD